MQPPGLTSTAPAGASKPTPILAFNLPATWADTSQWAAMKAVAADPAVTAVRPPAPSRAAQAKLQTARGNEGCPLRGITRATGLRILTPGENRLSGLCFSTKERITHYQLSGRVE